MEREAKISIVLFANRPLRQKSSWDSWTLNANGLQQIANQVCLPEVHTRYRAIVIWDSWDGTLLHIWYIYVYFLVTHWDVCAMAAIILVKMGCIPTILEVEAILGQRLQDIFAQDRREIFINLRRMLKEDFALFRPKPNPELERLKQKLAKELKESDERIERMRDSDNQYLYTLQLARLSPGLTRTSPELVQQFMKYKGDHLILPSQSTC